MQYPELLQEKLTIVEMWWGHPSHLISAPTKRTKASLHHSQTFGDSLCFMTPATLLSAGTPSPLIIKDFFPG